MIGIKGMALRAGKTFIRSKHLNLSHAPGRRAYTAAGSWSFHWMGDILTDQGGLKVIGLGLLFIEIDFFCQNYYISMVFYKTPLHFFSEHTE